MRFEFTKMHGLGNDFIVIDAINQDITLDPQQIRTIANRHTGVGCDQLLLVERPHNTALDFRYRIFNADGGEVEQCGNGARCFSLFVHEKGLSSSDNLKVETSGGIIEIQRSSNGLIRVNMGIPQLEPDKIPFKVSKQAIQYPLEGTNPTIIMGVVSMGNPHAVTLVDDIDTTPVERLGSLIESHLAFPQHVNAGFMQVITPSHIRLRVYERGAGETLACGTGACAAVVWGRLLGKLESEVRVSLRGGDLIINWSGEHEPVYMSGPATRVFEGQIEL
ncbi:MAG: diaminopimelate epimerase [Gammaproteobacteria bacterium]|nr:diaminopimelate epimerase [Gammaproteobacteria bacterium]